MSELTTTNDTPAGLDRRRFLRNAGIAGSAAWVIPTVMTRSPAFGQATSGSAPPCQVEIDNFDDVQGPLETGTAGQIVTDAKATANAIGGVRDLYLEQVNEVTGFDPNAVFGVIGATLNFSNDPGIRSIARVRYDGSFASSTPSLAANIQGTAVSPAFILRIDNSDVAFTATVRVTSNTGNFTVSKAVGAAQLNADVVFPYSEFVGVNFANVTSIELEMTSVNGGLDVVAQFLGAACPTSAP